MKSISSILFVIFFCMNHYTQDLPQEFKDKVLANLYSSDYSTRREALNEAYIFNIPETIPILENILWNQDRILGSKVLEALAKYNSPNYFTLAHQFFDALDTMRVEKKYLWDGDSLEIKADIVFDLFSKGDYSKVDFLFQYIALKKPGSFLGITFLLREVLNNVPEYHQQAKDELFRIAKWDGVALIMISERYGSEANEVAANAFVNSKDAADRNIALQHLIKYDHKNTATLLKSRIFVDTVWTSIFVDDLLNEFGSSENYKFIKDNLHLVSAESEIQKINSALEWFVPATPDSFVSIDSQIDHLTTVLDTIYEYIWLGDSAFSGELKNIITLAKTNLLAGDSLSCRSQVQAFQGLVDNVYKDSLNPDPRFVTLEGWKFLYWNAQYITDRLPEPPANPNLVVNLKSSTGTLLTTGSLQYYEGSWKDAANNGDGTFTVVTNLNTVSLRMTYEYGSQTVNNITAHNNTYTFQTVSANVQLKNSLGSLIDTGTVQYYAGAWRSFGTTANGVATKELLPINYSFRMTYEYASIDKQQNLSVDPTVVFQTVNASVQLKNSFGNLIDVGTIQYYAGAWRSFGTTSNGVATKELLPINYSFRMTYEFASIDKQQNLSVDPTVVFQTVNAAVQLKNSLGNLIDQGTVQYYAGAWRSFGTTSNGVATKELLPINYSFRMTHAFLSKDKQQNISTNPVVEFQTVLCSVKVSNANNQPFNNATVRYYAGSWRDLGVTNLEGIATKELLPQNISFRASYGNVSLDKQQDIGANSLVEIQLNVP